MNSKQLLYIQEDIILAIHGLALVMSIGFKWETWLIILLAILYALQLIKTVIACSRFEKENKQLRQSVSGTTQLKKDFK
jgi:hypothetical protein